MSYTFGRVWRPISEEVAEPVGGDQRDLAAATLDQRVGADRGAVGQAGRAGRVERVRGQHFADPVDDRPVRAFGGRRMNTVAAPAGAMRLILRGT